MWGLEHACRCMVDGHTPRQMYGMQDFHTGLVLTFRSAVMTEARSAACLVRVSACVQHMHDNTCSISTPRTHPRCPGLLHTNDCMHAMALIMCTSPVRAPTEPSAGGATSSGTPRPAPARAHLRLLQPADAGAHRLELSRRVPQARLQDAHRVPQRPQRVVAALADLGGAAEWERVNKCACHDQNTMTQ